MVPSLGLLGKILLFAKKHEGLLGLTRPIYNQIVSYTTSASPSLKANEIERKMFTLVNLVVLTRK